MRILKLGVFGAAVVLGSFVTIGALAQAPAGQPPAGGRQGRGGFGQGRFGGGFGGITLVNAPVDVLAKESPSEASLRQPRILWVWSVRGPFPPWLGQ